MILFFKSTYAKYKALNPADLLNIYFTTDTGQLFVGDAEYGGITDVNFKTENGETFLTIHRKGIGNADKTVNDFTSTNPDYKVLNLTKYLLTTDDRNALTSIKKMLEDGGLSVTYTPAEALETIQMPNAVGGIKKNTKGADLKGRTMSEIFDDLFFPTIEPVVSTKPSLTLSLNNFDAILEVGTVLLSDTEEITSKFKNSANKGSVSLNGVPQGDYTGAVSNVKYYYGTTVNADNLLQPSTLINDVTYPKTVLKGEMSYIATADFADGPEYKNNKGLTSALDKFTATNIKSNVCKIYGVYSTMYGNTNGAAGDDNTLSIIDCKTVKPTSWSSSNAVTLQFTISDAETATDTGVKKHAFGISKEYTLTKVETYNSLSGKYESVGDINSHFKVKENGLNYNIYINSDSALSGETKYQITYNR